MIIVEGMDNTGKTTLIQEVAEALKLTIVKTYHKPWGAYEDMVHYSKWIEESPYPVILDRHPYISDYIYGHIIRGHTYASLSLLRWCLYSKTVIYCRPPDSIILGSMDDRPQMEGVSDNAKQLLKEYDAHLLTRSLKYDYTVDSPGKIIDYLRTKVGVE